VSEFSSSFHIRTGDAALAERRLVAAKISGLAFGPANGWLTFVPFANSQGFDARDPVGAATALANATGSFVLQYTYAEVRWPRLFGQIFRFDKWIVCRG
jgi:hypothetical protein